MGGAFYFLYLKQSRHLVTYAVMNDNLSMRGLCGIQVAWIWFICSGFSVLSVLTVVLVVGEVYSGKWYISVDIVYVFLFFFI